MRKTSSHQKAIDYHHMIEFILDEFKECQQENLPFRLSLNNQNYDINLKIPVLYIIGDTEGLDKICGRYTSRNNIQRPCRCCDYLFAETDNPEFKFKLNNHNKMMKVIRKGSKASLREISQHNILMHGKMFSSVIVREDYLVSSVVTLCIVFNMAYLCTLLLFYLIRRKLKEHNQMLE